MTCYLFKIIFPRKIILPGSEPKHLLLPKQISKYKSEKLQVKYFKLNELENKLEGVKNYHIAVRERGQQIVFLRTLERGGSEHSFGIQVAQLAGIPNSVLLRSSSV